MTASTHLPDHTYHPRLQNSRIGREKCTILHPATRQTNHFNKTESIKPPQISSALGRFQKRVGKSAPPRQGSQDFHRRHFLVICMSLHPCIAFVAKRLHLGNQSRCCRRSKQNQSSYTRSSRLTHISISRKHFADHIRCNAPFTVSATVAHRRQPTP